MCIRDRLSDPDGFGFTNIEASVLDGESGLDDLSFDGAGADFFFWDNQAPTTCVHLALAEYVLRDVFPSRRGDAKIEVLAARDDLVRVQTTRLDTGSLYMLRRSTDLLNWTQTPFTAPGPTKKFTFTREGKSKEFFEILSVDN